ncbi:hypothetical protein J53TS2_10130 [Paenibacillus sp. J53TS2]|uniref:SGNH/GDSL hydrolase family protein n=1 Tax=Paenibacillus sp. J53TS2 TaxID=2807197 RepID=UPI001B1305F8|nr:SGNH/GDSL hydrolase family protein [Paenibacillus sp. J53TS2]GIP47422.1 hypothetical protein J53TS2_10130 [Paenibacillus sp. J53TS2]
MERILIFGDSFSLPRFYENTSILETRYQDTYPEFLRVLIEESDFHTKPTLLNFSQHANNTMFLIREAPRLVSLYEPDIIIIQLGLVDCWERKPEHQAIYPELNGKNPWITEDEFYKNIITFIEWCISSPYRQVKNIILCNIPRVSEDQYQKHLGSLERTIKYNQLLEEIKKISDVFVLDMYSLYAAQDANEILISDGIHPNQKGGQIIAGAIFNKLHEIDIEGRALGVALEIISNGQMVDGINALNSIRNNNKYSLKINYYLSLTYFEYGDVQTAQQIIDECLQNVNILFDQDYASRIYQLKGNCFIMMNFMSSAVDSFCRSLIYNERNNEAFYQLFEILCVYEKSEVVFDFFTKKFKVTPDKCQIISQIYTDHGQMSEGNRYIGIAHNSQGKEA